MLLLSESTFFLQNEVLGVSIFKKMFPKLRLFVLQDFCLFCALCEEAIIFLLKTTFYSAFTQKFLFDD